MAQNSGTVLRPDLALLANEFALEASRQGFVGLNIMPRWDSAVQTASYKYVKPGEMLKNVETKRAPGSAYSRSTHAFESQNFTCVEYGHEEPIDDTEASANIGFDDESSAVRRCTDIILRAHERRVQAIAHAQTNTGAVGTSWATTATCTPKTDVRDAKITVRNLIGVEPDLFVCPEAVYNRILESTDFKSRTQYVNNVEGVSEALKRSLVASYLGVQELIVATAVYNTADEGVGDGFTATDIWDDDEAFLLVRPRGGLADPGQFGRTVIWTQMGRNLVNVDNYREEQTASQVYRTRMYADEAVVNPNAIYRITNLD
jgi:hypothetical protein